MKTPSLLAALLLALIVPATQSIAQDATATVSAADKSDSDIDKRAADWAGSLNLTNADATARVTAVISTHLKAVRDWHNTHSGTNVPAGINPATGKPLSILDRQFIADSAIPKSVHTDLMTGLRKDLNDDQVAAILDKYTMGKVAFTLTGYHAIVPDLTPQEETTILGYLKQAREEAVDYKNAKLISMVFEVYKTKSEQYLNSNGRNWHALYGAYTKAIIEKKKAAAEPAK